MNKTQATITVCCCCTRIRWRLQQEELCVPSCWYKTTAETSGRNCQDSENPISLVESPKYLCRDLPDLECRFLVPVPVRFSWLSGIFSIQREVRYNEFVLCGRRSQILFRIAHPECSGVCFSGTCLPSAPWARVTCTLTAFRVQYRSAQKLHWSGQIVESWKLRCSFVGLLDCWSRFPSQCEQT